MSAVSWPITSRTGTLKGTLEYHDLRIPVLHGELDSQETFLRANIKDVKLVLVNREDTVNTKIILTIRHLAPDIPIAAIATDDESVDVLQLSGADRGHVEKRQDETDFRHRKANL